MKTRNFDLIGVMVKIAGLVLFGALVFPEQAKFIPDSQRSHRNRAGVHCGEDRLVVGSVAGGET